MQNSFPVVKQPCYLGMLAYQIGCSTGVCSSSTGADHASSVAQKAKIIQSIFVPVATSRGFLLSVVTLAGAT